MPVLDDIPLWLDALAFVLLLSIAVEAGDRAGLRQRRTNESAEKSTRGDVTLLLLAIAALSLAVAGHSAGVKAGINRPRMAGFVLILSFLMIVILDFDRPQSGFIRLSNAPLVSAVEDMERALKH